MKNQPLFNRNFTMVVVGQIISLFGNALLSFALPLHLLRLTGSGTLFGGVMALSVLPAVFLSPIGGMLADRVSRRDIMVALDFFTCAVILCSGFFMGSHAVLCITVVLVLLSVIRSFYQPAVQACIPSITVDCNLLKANSVVNMVSSVCMLAGPIAGGFLYGLVGILPILAISGAAFFLSAVMELFIRLPFTPPALHGGILQTLRQDFTESIHFILRQEPVIGKTMGIAAFINLSMSSLLMIGLPYMVTITLGLGSDLYGLAQSVMGAGALAGGILVGVLAGRITPPTYYKLLLYPNLSLLPLGVVLLFPAPPMVVYAVLLFCTFTIMTFATMLSVAAVTLIQRVTPAAITGKVMAFVVTVSMCATPAGQAIYGFLFEALAQRLWIILFGEVLVSLCIVHIAKKIWASVSL